MPSSTMQQVPDALASKISPEVDRTPSGSGAWQLALWGALGGAFGAALVFAFLENPWHKHWLGFLLAVVWILTWKRYLEPHVEEKLSGAEAKPPHVGHAAPAGRTWLMQAIVSLLVVASVVVVEAMVELMHSHARERPLHLMQQVIGNALNIFAITLAWVLGGRRSRLWAACSGAGAGLVMTSVIIISVGLWINDGSLPKLYVTLLWLPSTLFFTLAGFLGGWAAYAPGAKRPARAAALALVVVVVVWNLLMIPVVPILARANNIEVSALELIVSMSVNTLRVLGWLGGLWCCPGSNEVMIGTAPSAHAPRVAIATKEVQ